HAQLLSGWAAREGLPVGIRIVTAEASPLATFGPAASRRVAGVLAEAGIELICGSEPVLVSDTTMTAAGRWVTADRIVSLPRLAGPRIPGVPCDWHGFVKVDAVGAVPGCPGVYAAGDGAAHVCKQGGLAAQQADLAVREILRGIGVSCPEPAEPSMLRGVLATTEGPLFLEATAGYGAPGGRSTASLRPLWDPPSKVATRWLSPHLDGLARRQMSVSAI
ncbi:MAG: sulfide:quinone oxidoreductase, partial [Solirubrobacteraceae bacterium]|nr:sulfide:quinone oxidoreductase [Solirubrobacteraceae bacterium]